MSSNPNAIASISVEITGDYSSLNDSIASAVSAAQTGAEQIASAFDVQVGQGIDDSLADMGTAADTAGQQMALFGEDLSGVPFDDAESSATDLTNSLDPIASSADDAGDALDDLATAAGDAGDAGHDAASGLSDAGDAADDAASGLSDAGDAADDAASGLSDAGDAADDAGRSASGAADGGLTDLREQLVAVGEALVITEGLKEFGEEALNAADNITHATIALTALTGSADQANSTIERLEALGQQDGLAMPSLLTAATRMQAILGPGADVTTLLGDIANGASVMQTDIVSATQRFDQMATAGTASAKTLASIGLSLQSLSSALNKVDPAADSTASSVAKMFKAMDESDRITVLTQALGNLQGVAQQTANATFGGQWTQLANAWEQVMAQAGQALLPVITDILDLTKTDIIPFLEGVTEAFRALPQPVQDTLAAIGLLVALAAPVAAGLATIALGISSIQTLIPAVTAALGTLSTMFGTTAASETDEAVAAAANGAAHSASVEGIEAATVAEGAAGTAAETLTGTLGGLAGVLSGVLAAGFLAYVAGSAQMEQAMANLKAKGDEIHATLLQHIQDIINAAQTLPQFQSAIDLVNTALENGSITEKQAASDMQTLASRAQQLGVDLTNASFGGTTLAAAIGKVGTAAAVTWANTNSLGISINTGASAAEVAAAKTQALAIAHQQLQQNVTTAQQALVNETAAFNNGQASAADVQKALTALTAAENLATPAVVAHGKAHAAAAAQVDTDTASVGAFMGPLPTAATEAQNAADAVNAWAAAHGLASPAVTDDTNATTDYTTSVTNASGKLNDFNDGLGTETNAAGSLAHIFPDLAGSVGDYGVNVQSASTAQSNVVTTGNEVSTMMAGLGLLVVQSQNNYDVAKANYLALVASWRQGNDVGSAVAAAYQKMQQAAQQLKQYTDQLKSSQDALNGSLDGSTQSLTNFLTKAGLLAPAITAATPPAQQLNTSIVDLGTNTDTWNKSLQQATKSLGTDMASAITSVIDGTSSLGQAMEKLGEDMLNICLNIIIKQALAPVESAIADLFGVASSASSSLGGAAGGGTSAIGSAVSGIMAAVSSVISVISGIVTAIASVISAVEQAHANTLLTRIEENTRYTSGSLNQPGGVIYLMQQDQGMYQWIVTNTGDANGYLDTIANATSLLLTASTSAGQTPEETTLANMLTAETSMLTTLQSIYAVLQSGITIGSSGNGTVDPTQNGALLSQIASNTAWLQDIDSILKTGEALTTAGTSGVASGASSSFTPSGEQVVDITPSGAVGGAILTLSSTMVQVFQSIGQQNSNLFGTFFPMADIAENILPPMATDLKSMHAISQADQPQLTYISKTLGLAAGLFGNANGSLYTIDRNVASIMSIVAKLAGVSVPSAPSGAGGNAGKPSGGGTGSGSGTVTSATMAVSINVNGANNPRDTATQIASYLRSISPVFTVGSK